MHEKQGRKRPLDTPKRMIKRREIEGKKGRRDIEREGKEREREGEKREREGRRERERRDREVKGIER